MHKPQDKIFYSWENCVEALIEGIETYRLALGIGSHLDLYQTLSVV